MPGRLAEERAGSSSWRWAKITPWHLTKAAATIQAPARTAWQQATAARRRRGARGRTVRRRLLRARPDRRCRSAQPDRAGGRLRPPFRSAMHTQAGDRREVGHGSSPSRTAIRTETRRRAAATPRQPPAQTRHPLTSATAPDHPRKTRPGATSAVLRVGYPTKHTQGNLSSLPGWLPHGGPPAHYSASRPSSYPPQSPPAVHQPERPPHRNHNSARRPLTTPTRLATTAPHRSNPSRIATRTNPARRRSPVLSRMRSR